MRNDIRDNIRKQIGFNVDYYSSFDGYCFDITNRRISGPINMKLWGSGHRQVLERLMHEIHVSINSQMNEK